jgi:hypothetical protein
MPTIITGQFGVMYMNFTPLLEGFLKVKFEYPQDVYIVGGDVVIAAQRVAAAALLIMPERPDSLINASLAVHSFRALLGKIAPENVNFDDVEYLQFIENSLNDDEFIEHIMENLYFCYSGFKQAVPTFKDLCIACQKKYGLKLQKIIDKLDRQLLDQQYANLSLSQKAAIVIRSSDHIVAEEFFEENYTVIPQLTADQQATLNFTQNFGPASSVCTSIEEYTLGSLFTKIMSKHDELQKKRIEEINKITDLAEFNNVAKWREVASSFTPQDINYLNHKCYKLAFQAGALPPKLSPESLTSIITFYKEIFPVLSVKAQVSFIDSRFFKILYEHEQTIFKTLLHTPIKELVLVFLSDNLLWGLIPVNLIQERYNYLLKGLELLDNTSKYELGHVLHRCLYLLLNELPEFKRKNPAAGEDIAKALEKICVYLAERAELRVGSSSSMGNPNALERLNLYLEIIDDPESLSPTRVEFKPLLTKLSEIMQQRLNTAQSSGISRSTRRMVI